MDARRALMKTNDMVSMRPFVILAIKVMAPGPRRVQMVKLAHEMSTARADVGPVHRRLQLAVDKYPQPAPPSQRAA
jgi:hypothetical protein